MIEYPWWTGVLFLGLGCMAIFLVQDICDWVTMRMVRNNKKQKHKNKKTHSPNDPPSIPQLDYISGLGGNLCNVKTFGEAGEYIGRLKKEKNQ